MTDVAVMTDSAGRAALPHGLDGAPQWAVVRLGDGATNLQRAVIRLTVDGFDDTHLSFQAIRTDTGTVLANVAIPVRLSVR